MNKHQLTLRLGAMALAAGLLTACGGGGSGGNSGDGYPTTMTAAKMADLLAGKTWESPCLLQDQPAPDEGKYYKFFIAPKKVGNNTITALTLEHTYHTANCSGKPVTSVLDDEAVETFIVRLGTPVKKAGLWVVDGKIKLSNPKDPTEDKVTYTLKSPSSFEEKILDDDGKPFALLWKVSKENFDALRKEAERVKKKP